MNSYLQESEIHLLPKAEILPRATPMANELMVTLSDQSLWNWNNSNIGEIILPQRSHSILETTYCFQLSL